MIDKHRMDTGALIRNMMERLAGMKKSQAELNDELLNTGTCLDEALETMDAIDKLLGQIEAKKTALESPRTIEDDRIPAPELSTLLEKLLQESIGRLEERLSENMLEALKELRDAAGPVREVKSEEFGAPADGKQVDLSAVLVPDRVESNIEELGIEETESKGVDRSLEKLRGMKDGL